MNQTEQNTGRIILRFGLLGGGIAFYFSAIGMVETFAQRPLIGTFISLGQILLVIGAIGSGLLAARSLRRERPGESSGRILGASAAAGAVSSLPLIVLVLIIQIFVVLRDRPDSAFRLREMFVNFSPGLVAILTFGQALVPGLLLLIVASGLLGAFGALFVVLPSRWRVAIINALAWTLAMGIFSENVGQILQRIFGRGLMRLVFVNQALSPIAAAVILVGAFLVAYFRAHEIFQKRWTAMPAGRQRQGQIFGIILGVALLLLLPWALGLFLSQALFLVGLYIMMGLGLNIVVGYAGLLDLGYVAFFAFGAYTMGVLTSTGPLGFGLNFWAALPFCVLVGVVWGLLLGFPVLRMRGDYLAIVTLGFGEIIRILALSDWLAPVEGGAQGILFIPHPTLFGYTFNTPQTMYYLVILGSLLAAFVTVRLRDSRLGRQWMAMREDEDVAEAMGINLIQTKLLAFAIGAAFSALAGGIFAARLGNIFPHSFNLLISLNALALIIVGGMGSIPGVVVGALILVGLPELLREFTEYRLLMYGVLLIVMMLVRPEGFIPEATRQRELHAGEEERLESSIGAFGEAEV